MKSLGQRLRARARELGLSDAEVARRAGLGERRYGNYVADEREPDNNVLLRLCAVLNTDPNTLLGFGPDIKGVRAGQSKEKTNAISRLSAAVAVMNDSDLPLLNDIVAAVVKQSKKSNAR